MKLISIRLQNVRKHADTFIAFPPRGVIGVVGENESGKSTVLEGITWALFGSAGIRQKVETLRWKGAHAKRRPTVELVFELDERFRIVRTDRNAEVFVGADETPAAAGTSAVNTYLAERLGLSYDEFRSIFLCSQKDLTRISAMLPSERQQLIREIMGISRIDRAHEACRKRRNELNRERDGLAAGLGEREPLAADVESTRAAVDDAEARAGDANDAADEAYGVAGDANDALAASLERKELHDAAERRRLEAEANARAARAEVERLSVELDQVHEARAELIRRELELAPLPGLRAERDRLVAARSASSERETLRQTITAAEQDVATYGGYVADCGAATRAHDPAAMAEVIESYRRTDARLRALISDREQQLATARAEVASAMAEAKRIWRRIELLEQQGPNGACPTCAQVLGERFAAVIAELRADLVRLNDTEAAAQRVIADSAESTDDEGMLEAELEALKSRGEELRQRERDALEANEKRAGWVTKRDQAKRRLEDAKQRLEKIPDPNPLVTIGDELADEGRATRLTAVEQEIARLEKVDAQLAKLRALVGRLDLLNQQRAAADQRVKDALGHSEQAFQAIEASGFDAEQHAALQQRATAAAEALASARQAAALAAERLTSAREAAQKAQAALDAYDTRAAALHELTRSVELHERAAGRLDAFRVAAAGTLRPEMEEYVSGFVSVLTDGRHESVTVGDDFSIVCQEQGVDMEVISGGAEDVVALAQRVAASQMVAERRGKPLSLLVLDEPFGYLDDVRRPAMLNFIRRLSDTFQQVLLISHIDETRTCADFLVELEHDERAGCSRVRVPIAPAETEPLLAGVAA